MVMIKDNHIAAAGGIPQAVRATEAFMRAKGLERPLEVETRTLDELREVRRRGLRAGCRHSVGFNCCCSGRRAGVYVAPLCAAPLTLIPCHPAHLRPIPCQVLAILDGAGGGSMVTRVMLDNMTRKDASKPGVCCCRPLRVGVREGWRGHREHGAQGRLQAGCVGRLAARAEIARLHVPKMSAATRRCAERRRRSHTPPAHCLPACLPVAGLDVSTLAEAMQLIGDRSVETEASGNVTLETVRCVPAALRRALGCARAALGGSWAAPSCARLRLLALPACVPAVAGCCAGSAAWQHLVAATHSSCITP